MAEDMKRNNGFIPGVKPGKETADYIDSVMSHLTLPGSLFIAVIAILPHLRSDGALQGASGFCPLLRWNIVAHPCRCGARHHPTDRQLNVGAQL